MDEELTTVYMIGNGHIDPVWLWRWQEGFAEVLGTCRSALDRMDEFPDFVFTRAGAATYKWIEDADPAMFAEIKKRVKEGRWSIVGGWWEQPDCNIPSGESFVRHELYGKRYFLDKFGFDVTVGYNVDSFGHNAGLPQILSKAGIRYYTFMRPEAHEKTLPDSMFYWEGPDGSRVLVHRLRGPYTCGSGTLAQHLNDSVDARPRNTDVAACFYGVGNHGGGPTIESIKLIKSLQSDQDGPRPVFGTLNQFFEHATRERTDFPVVRGDLQHHAVGCYTAHSEVKKLNRKAENALVSAEKYCGLAKIGLDRAFPEKTFADAWQTLLFSQFHDILAGTSLDVAYHDVRDALGGVISKADYEANAALSAIAAKIDLRGEGDPFVVFNSLSFPVKCAIYFDENAKSLRDYGGRGVPVQRVTPFFEHTGSRARNVFVDELPPLGYKLYYAGNWDRTTPTKGKLEASETLIANDFYRIEIDPKSGAITRIFDERLKAELLKLPAGPVILEDDSDTWSHGVVRYNDLAGRPGNAKVEVVENGPVRSTLRIESTFNDSTIWQDLSLYAESDIIEFAVYVDWHEKHRMLKFEFPLAVEDPVATYDTAYAVVTAPTDGAENPGQKWIDVGGRIADKQCGVSLLNDCKYGFDVEGATMRISAIRSPIYAFHDPRQVEPGKRYHYMDQGLNTFRFALLPHAGSWKDADTVSEALLMNMQPMSVETHHHSGTWPGEKTLASVSVPNVDLCALKAAEDGDGIILRLYETSGRPTDTTLKLLDASYPVSLRAFELKTLRVYRGKASEVDLIERPQRT